MPGIFPGTVFTVGARHMPRPGAGYMIPKEDKIKGKKKKYTNRILFSFNTGENHGVSREDVRGAGGH